MPTYPVNTDRFSEYDRDDGELHLLINRPYCRFCYKPIPEKFAGTGKCYHCEKNKNDIPTSPLSRVVATTVYIPETDFLHNDEILELKEQGEHADAFAEVLGHLLAERTLVGSSIDRIVPIPPTSKRVEVSGPTALAHRLADRTDLVVSDVLQFSREVKSQKGLNAEQRKDNVEDAMTTEARLDGATVLLVDDILTTGATMVEAANTLADAGASDILGGVAGRDADIDSLQYAGVLGDAED